MQRKLTVVNGGTSIHSYDTSTGYITFLNKQQSGEINRPRFCNGINGFSAGLIGKPGA
jgi:hypothetical protein